MAEPKKQKRVDPVLVRVRASGQPGGRIATITWPDKTEVEIEAGSDGEHRYVTCDRALDVGPGVAIPAGARIFVK